MNILSRIEEIVLRVANMSDSLVHNMNNNLVEAFNCTAMHLTGKKVVNFTGRLGYRGRSFKGLVHYNEWDSYRVLHKHLRDGVLPGTVYKHCKQTQLKKHLHNQKSGNKKASKQKLDFHKADQFYGPDAQQADMDLTTYKLNAEKMLRSLKVTKEDVARIEVQTRGQASSDLWHRERENRLTASNFKRICSMQTSTSTAAAVKEFVKKNFVGNKHTAHGNKYEPVARQLLEQRMGCSI